MNNIWEVDQLTDEEINKPIKDLKLEDISELPVELPSGYRFGELELQEDAQLEELADFLQENYI